MKKICNIFIISFIAFGQSGDYINVFNVGNIGLTGIFKVQNFAPPGAFNAGTASSFFSKSPELVFYNAAALADIYEPKLSIDINPPSVNVLNYADESFDNGIQGEIQSSLEKELKSYQGSNSDPYTYPTFTHNMKQTLSINSLSFVLPIENFRLGFGFTQFADFGLNFLLTGTGLQLEHEDDANPINELSFIIQNEMAFDLSLKMSEQIFSTAYRITDDFNVGLSFINTSISGRLVADIQLDGFIRKQGEIIPFNTTNTETITNYMNQKIDGQMQSNHSQYRFSINAEATDWLGFSFTYLNKKEEKLNASFLMDINYPNFMSGEGGDSFVNVDNSLLDAANATRTRNITHEASNFKLFRAGKIAFVTTLNSGNFYLALEVDKYSGSDGFTYQSYDEKRYTVNDFTKKYDTIEREDNLDQKFLLEPKIGGKLGLKWGIFSLGAGFTSLELVQTKDDLEDRSELIYGHFLMGFSFELLNQLDMNLTLISSSLPVGRLTFNYTL